jgi:hypothetical protein
MVLTQFTPEPGIAGSAGVHFSAESRRARPALHRGDTAAVDCAAAGHGVHRHSPWSPSRFLACDRRQGGRDPRLQGDIGALVDHQLEHRRLLCQQDAATSPDLVRRSGQYRWLFQRRRGPRHRQPVQPEQGATQPELTALVDQAHAVLSSPPVDHHLEEEPGVVEWCALRGCQEGPRGRNFSTYAPTVEPALEWLGKNAGL